MQPHNLIVKPLNPFNAITERNKVIKFAFRSSGVKSKVNKLRAAFNSREADQVFDRTYLSTNYKASYLIS
jgi:hypothetical protein